MGEEHALSPSRPKTTPGRYARRIERSWADLLGRAVLLSPRDFKAVDRWYALGVPLAVVQEVLEAEAARPRRQAPALASLSRAVEDTWSAVLAGRLTGEDVPQQPRAQAIDRWRLRQRAEPQESGLGQLLGELLAQYDAGQGAAAVDDELDRRIEAVVNPALRAATERALERAFASYRGRMSAEAFERTWRRARLLRLRRQLGLPRLATTSPAP